jgi:hypothetical protein
MSSFFARRFQKHKSTNDLTVFFVMLGSARVKALGKTLVKLTPGVNFINVFCARILYECLFLVMFKLEKDVCTKNACKKHVQKTLVKLTLGVNFINLFGQSTNVHVQGSLALSVSPTTLCPPLQVNTTRIYAQLLLLTNCTASQ